MYEAVYGLAVDLKAHLDDKMVDNIPAVYADYLAYTDRDGDERTLSPPLIQLGRLQQDPTTLSGAAEIPSAAITIHAGDPDSDDWQHGLATGGADSNLGMYIHTREIGGGVTWWRRLKIEFEAYFIYSDQTQAEAMRLGNLYRVLIERYCQTRSSANPQGFAVGGTQYAFGETALSCEVAKAFAVERGGPEDDYIWDGSVWLQVLTEIAA